MMISLYVGMILILVLTIFFILSPLIRLHRRTRSVQDGRMIKLTAIMFIIAVPLMVIVLYLHWGSINELKQYDEIKKKNKAIKALKVQYGSKEAVVERMEQVLALHPDGAKGWYLLGRLYVTNGDYQKAVDAFEKAKTLDTDNLDAQWETIQAKYYLHHETLSKANIIELNQLIEGGFNSAKAHNLLAIDAYKKKHYSEAIMQWSEIFKGRNKNDSEALIIQEELAMARRAKLAPIHFSVPITVELLCRFTDKVKPSDVVFIALKSNHQSMPIAAIKRQVKDLPLIITLDESMLMQSNVNPSGNQHVKIIARISFSGQAIAQKGDIEGESIAFNLRKPTTEKVIKLSKYHT